MHSAGAVRTIRRVKANAPYAELLRRIETGRKRLGKASEAKVCRDAGLGKDCIRTIRRGNAPRAEALKKLERAIKCEPGHLLEAVGGEAFPGPAHPATAETVELLGELYAVVPVFDARVSAGPGALNQDGDPVHHHLYRMAWLREVTSTPPPELAVVRVEGDSMWETLHHGDHVLMDRRVRRIGRDGIYVLGWADEEETMVKRAQRDPRNRLITIKSDNPAYGSWADVADERVRIFGKVIWLGRNVGG